jgi:cytochrome c-type biogenesis protein CcmE
MAERCAGDGRAGLERLVRGEAARERAAAGIAGYCGKGNGEIMTPRRKRMWVVLGILGGVAAAATLAMMASRENIMFYFDPTQIASGQAPHNKRFRVGGMVVKGSVQRDPGSIEVRFLLSDFAHEVPVKYAGVLPDLFREGQGVIAHGTMDSHGTFIADEVLAKHDEKYMPPEVAASLKNKRAAAAPGTRNITGNPQT